MKKAILSVAALSLIAFGTSAQAEVITYQCGGGTVRVDTKTLSLLVINAGGQRFPGHAKISSTTISFTEDGQEGSAQIDRRTGKYVDSDGETVICHLAK